MNSVRVVSKNKDGTWANRGLAHRHKRGAGWNVMLSDGPKNWSLPLVMMDAGDLAPGSRLRVRVTRAAVEGGTDWFEVGQAWVSKEGREVIAQIEARLPANESTLVVLHGR